MVIPRLRSSDSAEQAVTENRKKLLEVLESLGSRYQSQLSGVHGSIRDIENKHRLRVHRY